LLEDGFEVESPGFDVLVDVDCDASELFLLEFELAPSDAGLGSFDLVSDAGASDDLLSDGEREDAPP